MQPNPALRKLGFADDDRLVIIHIDDIGMCQSTLSALDELLDFGLVSSGAVMVPCPWFQQTALYLRHRDADIGVHLTLTSEWDGYRWGPISTRAADSGLLDEEGYFYHTEHEVQQHGDPAAAAVELKAQIARALAAGIDVTHIDSHMGALAHPKFVPIYVQLALDYRLPPTILLRGDETHFRAMGLDAHMTTIAIQTMQMLEEQGVVLLDNVVGLPLNQPDNRLEQAKAALAALPSGITHFYIHPAHDTPELRALAPDWPSRVADFETFMSAELRAYIREQGIHIIGNRPLRDLMRSTS
jgi:predicted glycoside hydrolase/deacetylase ChbG (UPF0249 family)